MVMPQKSHCDHRIFDSGSADQALERLFDETGLFSYKTISLKLHYFPIVIDYTRIVNKRLFNLKKQLIFLNYEINT